MAGNQTFTMIKPTAFRNYYTGKILALIEEAGFRIKALKLVQLTHSQAGLFYEIHKERSFYNDLVQYMSSGSVVAAVLEKSNAVEAFRNFIGNTDPAKADPGTIRRLYGTNIQENAVHGSDSDENALREIGFFFSELERI
jgi:nucleoside-diphosphate kinase